MAGLSAPCAWISIRGVSTACRSLRAAGKTDMDAHSREDYLALSVKMPRILYGTAWKKGRTKELCLSAIHEGYRGFDTACQPKHYNQRGLGEALEEAVARGNIEREDLFIQTKYTPVGGQDPRNIPYDPKLPLREQVAQSIQVSLRELGVSYIDSVLLHSPLGTPEETLDVWRGLEAAIDDGFVRIIGISNCYSLEELQELYGKARIKPGILQNRFYAATGYDMSLREWCTKNDIIYQAFWSLTANPHILRNPLVVQTAERIHCTPEQLWFRYMIQQDIVPLTGTSSLKHMREDLESVQMILPESICNHFNTLLKSN